MTSQLNSDGTSRIAADLDRAIVFRNAQAGRAKADRLLPLLKQAFLDHGMSPEMRTTSTANEMEAQAKEAIEAGARSLFAFGGDGTLQGLVNAAFGHDVVLGVIPGGGGNDFARALGLPREPLAALGAQLRGEARSVDLASARTGDGRTRLYLGGGGVGLDADAARFAGGRYRNWPGRWRYVAAAIHAFALHQPRRVRIALESSQGRAEWQDSVLACVLNTPTFGAGIRLAPDAQISDGLLDCVLLEELGFGRLLRILPRLALEGSLHIPQLRRVQFRKLRLETERPAYFHGDGELLGPTPVEIEVVPAGARFLAPKVAGA